MLKIYLLGSCPTCEATEEQFRNIGYFGVSLQNMVPVGTTGSSSSSRKTGEWYNTIRFLFDFKFRPRGHRSLFSLLSSAGINLGLLLGINLGLFPTLQKGLQCISGEAESADLVSAFSTQDSVTCSMQYCLCSAIHHWCTYICVHIYICLCVYI